MSALPQIQRVVTLRPEVAKGRLHGIISLYALLDDARETFECDAGRVLSATFPFTALRRLLQRLQTSLGGRDSDRKGNFVISGGYGAGKRHVLQLNWYQFSLVSKSHNASKTGCPFFLKGQPARCAASARPRGHSRSDNGILKMLFLPRCVLYTRGRSARVPKTAQKKAPTGDADASPRF